MGMLASSPSDVWGRWDSLPLGSWISSLNKMKKERKVGLALNYDSVLEYLGQFGCFQRRMFLCMCLVSFLTGPPTVIFAFTGYELSYRCPVTSCGESSQSIYGPNETEATLPAFYQENSIQLADRCKVPQPRNEANNCGEAQLSFSSNNSE